MPLKDRYLSAKDNLRQLFGKDTPKTGLSLALNEQQLNPSPSSVPDKHPQVHDDTASVPSNFQSPPTGLSAYASATGVPGAALAPKPSEADSNSALGIGYLDAAATVVTPNPTAVESQNAVRWTGLKTLLTVLDASTGVFPPFKSAVGGLNSFIEIFENASRGRKDYAELLAKLDSLLGDLSGYAARITGTKMTTSMMNLCIGLDQELQIAQEKNARGAVRQHMEALENTNEILASYRRIQGYLERLAMNANLSMWETVSNLETESRLKALMPALSALYNSAESEVVQRRECTIGTRQKELAKLLSWARRQITTTEDVYWMNGMAGTGKTTIAYTLCAELDKTAELGASFFCSRQIPECRNVKLIIPSIAYQLARFSRPFRYALSVILEADPDVHTRVLKAQFDNLLAKPLAEVKHALPTDFIVVIDALDECENEDSIGQILDVLFSHSSNSDLPVRFLISSRPEAEIYRRMMSRVGDGIDARLVLHDLDRQVVKHDIETYLLAELASVDLSPSQLSSLVELSGVLFIFASTAARYIKDGQQYMEHEDRLDTILGLSLEPTDSKDEEIDKLYTSILRAAFQTDKVSKSVQTRLKTILDTIICAQEPMTLDGLAGLLGLRSGKQAGALLGSLSSVLNISESKGLVTTLHASFPDYMLDPGRSAFFYCDSPATHSRLSRQSFDAMRNLRPQFNICGLESSYLRDEEVSDLAERSNEVVLSQVFYACRYWIAHLELAGEPNEMKDLLWDILSERLLLWMEILNVKKSMKLGPDILQRAKVWSRTNSCPQKTIDLAHDAWRFVTMFASHAVSQSTPHIYTSMLPFWPEEAPVSKNYFTRPLGALQPRGTALTRRRLELLATWDFKGWPESISLSPDGTQVAIGCLSSAYVVDSTTREAVLGPLSHDDWIRSVAWSIDAKLLATGSNDKTVRIWQTGNGELVRGPLTGHSGKVTSVCFLPDGTRVVSASEDKTIRIWDLTNEVATVRIIEAHDDEVLSMHISPDGARIASGSRDKSIRIWDTKTCEMTCALTGHAGPIKSVRFSPDGARIASGSYDKTVRVWSNLGTDAAANELQGHTDQVYCVAFSSDGKRIVSGGHDHTIHIWEPNSRRDPVQTLRGHMNDVYSVAFSPDGTRLFSSSLDWTVRVWDLWSQGPVEIPLGGHTKAVLSVSYSNDGNRILSCSVDTTVCVWDATSGQLVLGPLQGHTHYVHTSCFSPDNTRIVSASEDRTIRLWDAQSGLPIGKPLTGHAEGVLSACFSPDGALIASGSKDMTIRLWDAQTQAPILDPLREHTDWVRPVYFLPDGSKIVSGAADRTIMIWDVKSGQRLLSPLLGHTGPVMTVAVSPDGLRFASGATDKTVRLWDAQTGQALPPPLQGHTARVKFLTFSSDSRYIVSGCDDATVRIWDAKTGQAVGHPIVGHTMGIHCCAFSPDGKRIVSSSHDRSIRVWDIADFVGRPKSQETERSSLNEGEISASAPSSFTLQEEGWVVDAQSRLLAWVPPDLRPALLRARNKLLISTGGSFELGFESAMLGKSWTEPYKR